MCQYEEDHIEFAILSIVKDPLSSLLPRLLSNVATVSALQARLDKIKIDWRKHTTGDFPDNLYASLQSKYYVYQLPNEQYAVSTKMAEFEVREDAYELMATRQKLLTEQAALRLDVREEAQLMENDEMRALSRRKDCGGSMQGFARLVQVKAPQRSPHGG